MVLIPGSSSEKSASFEVQAFHVHSPKANERALGYVESCLTCKKERCWKLLELGIVLCEMHAIVRHQ